VDEDGVNVRRRVMGVVVNEEEEEEAAWCQYRGPVGCS
jgi:hypothetical protein